MIKVLLYTDGQGWVVGRISYKMQELITDDIVIDVRKYVGEGIPGMFLEAAEEHDIIHFNNWDVKRFIPFIEKTGKPTIATVRSFRYPDYVKDELPHFCHMHIINEEQRGDFPTARYIPDAIFEGFSPAHIFKVGMAFNDDGGSYREYKGYNIVKEACGRLGIELVLADGKAAPETMRDFYESVDLVIVASKNEGFNTIAMECLSMNKPILTTSVGIPKFMNIHKFERNADNLVNELMKFYTYPQVAKYTWEETCKEFTNFYRKVYAIS